MTFHLFHEIIIPYETGYAIYSIPQPKNNPSKPLFFFRGSYGGHFPHFNSSITGSGSPSFHALRASPGAPNPASKQLQPKVKSHVFECSSNQPFWIFFRGNPKTGFNISFRDFHGVVFQGPSFLAAKNKT